MNKLTMVDDSRNYHYQAVPAGQSYSFKVRAINSGREGDFSPTITLVSAAVPGVVQNLIGDGSIFTMAGLSWQVPAANGNAPISAYQISSDQFGNGATTVADCSQMA